MRINYIQISNILSFKFMREISEAEKVIFDGGLNIIIGENGSGKSTILEVINFFFRRVIYRQFNINIESFERRRDINASERRQILTPINHPNFSNFRLDPNWDSENEEQRIRIEIQLDEIDKQNINNIKQNYEKISNITNEYSIHSSVVSDQKIDTCVIDIVLQRESGSFSINSSDNLEDCGFSYLINYHFFREAILLHNYLNPGEVIPPLFDSFTLISSYRNYSAFQPSVSLGSAPAAQQIHQIRLQDHSRSLNASDSSEPSIFGLVRLQLAERHFGLMARGGSPEEREAEANNAPFIVLINDRLRIVNLRCQIQLSDMRMWHMPSNSTTPAETARSGILIALALARRRLSTWCSRPMAEANSRAASLS